MRAAACLPPSPSPPPPPPPAANAAAPAPAANAAAPAASYPYKSYTISYFFKIDYLLFDVCNTYTSLQIVRYEGTSQIFKYDNRVILS